MTVVARDVDIVIVGGGIVGASCAYFLAERGAEVFLAGFSPLIVFSKTSSSSAPLPTRPGASAARPRA